MLWIGDTTDYEAWKNKIMQLESLAFTDGVTVAIVLRCLQEAAWTRPRWQVE